MFKTFLDASYVKLGASFCRSDINRKSVKNIAIYQELLASDGYVEIDSIYVVLCINGTQIQFVLLLHNTLYKIQHTHCKNEDGVADCYM